MIPSTLIFIFLALIWGSNFIYMKIASEFISPLQIVFIRVLFGFIPVFAYALVSKAILLSHLKYVHHFFIMSLLAASVYYYGFVIGSALLPSGIAGVLSATVPLSSFLLTALFVKTEKISKWKIVGIIMGISGVFCISNPFSSSFDENTLKGVFYLLFGSFSVGSSFVYAKKFISPLKISSSALTSYQLGFATLIMFFITDLEGIESIASNLHALIGTILLLSILGTGIAFIGYYYIIKKMGIIAASSVAYLPPVVALFIGAVIVGEDISLFDYFGAGLILLGVILLRK